MEPDELDELRQHLEGARSVVKATIRSCRGCLQYLADLEERLDALDISRPLEAQRHGSSNGTTDRPVRV